METKPQFFEFKIDNGEIINCHYFFSDNNTNAGTEKVDLYIRFSDPQRPTQSGFIDRHDTRMMHLSIQEMIKFCTTALNFYFHPNEVNRFLAV